MSDECPKCPPVGAPLWLATFADLMSLLMCFFVLLLSFATMDAKKFKKMADSMENAFGVQKDVPAYDIPMGNCATFFAGTDRTHAFRGSETNHITTLDYSC